MLYFDVALWSCEEKGFLVDVLKAIFTDFELARFKFVGSEDACLRLGYTRNSTKRVMMKPLEWISDQYKYAPENIVQIESIPNRTAYNSIFSSLYPPAYFGSSDDTFLRKILIPCLGQLKSPGDSMMNVLSLCYPAWSVTSLQSDWKRNKDVWSHYIIQKDGNADHLRMFNDSIPVYVYSYGQVL